MKYLIKCNGFIGDILFATSIAKKLKEENPNNIVDYKIPLQQPYYLLLANPYINDVYTANMPDVDIQLALNGYDKIIDIPQTTWAEPAPVQFQKVAGVKNPSPEFDVYTMAQHDLFAQTMLDGIKKNKPGAPVIGYDVAWRARAYQTTEEMINRGVGGPHRNTEWIVDQLRKHFIMVPMGLPEGVKQTDKKAGDYAGYSLMASLIKHCDFMVGPEGGLTNLSCALHTPTIITTCFIQQLYGPKGLFRPCSDPKMGPLVYYPNGGHIHLDPWITDEEVANKIIAHVSHVWTKKNIQ